MTLAYVVEYDAPIATVMTYPILVHNQPINSDFYQHTLPFELADRLALPSQSRRQLDQFTSNQYVTGFHGCPGAYLYAMASANGSQLHRRAVTGYVCG